jgi:hypothetical protein
MKYLILALMMLIFCGCGGKCISTGTCGNYDQSNVDFMLNSEPGWWTLDRKIICNYYQTLASNANCMVEWR